MRVLNRIFCVLIALLSLGIVLMPQTGATNSAETIGTIAHSTAAQIADTQIILAYYTEPMQVAVIAQHYDMLETEWDRDKQYVLIDTSQVMRDHLQAAGFELVVDDAMTARLQNELREKQKRSAETSATIPGYECYRTVEETLSKGANIAKVYTDLAEWIDIGDSWSKQNGEAGYDMRVLRLTNETKSIRSIKPIIFTLSSIHAREYAPAELNTRFAEHLVENYGSDPDITWLLDYHEIHMLLQANPDGRKAAETGNYHRKNGNKDACNGVNYYTGSSAHGGVDLNRNYAFNWGECNNESCSSSRACSATYRGSSGGSEPEMDALQTYVRSIFPDQRDDSYTAAAPDDAMGIYFDLHSYGEKILYPWGYIGESANHTQFQTLTRKLGAFNNYQPVLGLDFYPTDGSSKDFGYGELGVASMVLEMGQDFFQDCSTFDNSIVPENLPMLLYSVKAARAPFQLPAGPDPESVTTTPAVVQPGKTVTIDAYLDDTNFTDLAGIESVQNISAAAYYIDIPPYESGAVAVPMSAADGAFDSPAETVTASLDTTGLSNGQHTIYVRGQDTDDNWGVVTAQYIEISSNASIYQPIFTDDFENDLGWIVDPDNTDTGSTGAWERGDPEQTMIGNTYVMQVESAASGSNALITQLTAGNDTGSADVDDGVVSIQSRPITLPAADTIKLAIKYYFAHTNNADENDYLRVVIVANGATIVLEEVGSADFDRGTWQSTSIDLTPFAGQTIALRLEAADNNSPSLIEAGIDDITIVALNPDPITPAPLHIDLHSEQAASAQSLSFIVVWVMVLTIGTVTSADFGTGLWNLKN